MYNGLARHADYFIFVREWEHKNATVTTQFIRRHRLSGRTKTANIKKILLGDVCTSNIIFLIRGAFCDDALYKLTFTFTFTFDICCFSWCRL